ncbi:MAG TPA: YceI family protein [Trueperaceae bacterium]|nr:YceI family protein [Trueperaceae bacterium]
MAYRHWTIDPGHSTIEFSTKHMMFTTVRGRFKEFAGDLHLDREQPDRSWCEVTIMTASVDTADPDRDAHLRSAEFFAADDHPEIRFRSTGVMGAKAEEGSRFRVTGELTIADTVQEVVLDVLFQGRGQDPWGNERVGFTATTEVDRRDWGLKWNQVLETGGVLVANKVRIEAEVQAVLKGEAEPAGVA